MVCIFYHNLKKKKLDTIEYVLSAVYEVLEQTKLMHGNRGQESACFWMKF